jgi:hypothetical protein
MKGYALLAQLDQSKPFLPVRSGVQVPHRAPNMKSNKKEIKLVKAALKAQRILSKATRATIKDPTKLCDCCMNEWSWSTLEEQKLCDECYGEKYGKTKVG